MKRIIFIIDDLIIGGAQKSLLSLLSVLDFKQYKVDLLAFDAQGAFREFIPGEVNILNAESYYRDFFKPAREAALCLTRKNQIFLAAARMWLSVLSRITHNNACYMKCDYLVKLADESIYYDIAIACHYRLSNYFMLKNIHARKKMFWFHHGEYTPETGIYEFDRKCFARNDSIITVSEKGKTMLLQHFPEFQEKLVVLKNIIPTDLIRKMAAESDGFNKSKGAINLVSVGRLSREKGFDLAVEACKRLVDDRYPIKWYIVGEGVERPHLEAMIRKYGLEIEFILLGEKPNPYPYIKNADIYVQTSLTESFGYAIAEARVLGVPIVATDTPGALDQISSGLDGIITEPDAESICTAVRGLIDDPQKRNLIAGSPGNEKYLEDLQAVNNLFTCHD